MLMMIMVLSMIMMLMMITMLLLDNLMKRIKHLCLGIRGLCFKQLLQIRRLESLNWMNDDHGHYGEERDWCWGSWQSRWWQWKKRLFTYDNVVKQWLYNNDGDDNDNETFVSAAVSLFLSAARFFSSLCESQLLVGLLACHHHHHDWDDRHDIYYHHQHRDHHYHHQHWSWWSSSISPAEDEFEATGGFSEAPWTLSVGGCTPDGENRYQDHVYSGDIHHLW